ncbi:MAG TPA: CcmD family protein [Terriglobia bacterium]|nr:CcmD family protein [Terriglobia bacterium]
MTDANNKFLFLAYSLVWIVFMLYAWSIARRQSKLKRDLETLKTSLPTKDRQPLPKS